MGTELVHLQLLPLLFLNINSLALELGEDWGDQERAHLRLMLKDDVGFRLHEISLLSSKTNSIYKIDQKKSAFELVGLLSMTNCWQLDSPSL